MKWVRLAFRNVIRHRRRTIMATSIIATGTAAILVALGYMVASFWGLREVTIRSELGHIQMAMPGSFDEKEELPLAMGLSVNTVDHIFETTQDWPEIVNLLRRVNFEGIASTGERTSIFLGTASEPDKEALLAGFTLPMDTGRPLPDAKSGDEQFQLLLAKGIAQDLRAGLGDYVTLLGTTSYGALNGLDLTLSGTYQTGLPEYDKRALRTTLAAAQILLQSDKISKLAVHLKDTKKTQQVKQKLQAAFPDLEVRDWQQLAPFYNKVVTLYSSIFTTMSLIVMAVVLLSVTNTMLMSVMERVKEVGTLRAFGVSSTRLRLNFWYEGSLIGAIGGAIGMGFAYAISFFINKAQIMLPPPPGRTLEYPLMIMPDLRLYILVFGVMILLGGIAAWLPTRYITKLNIVGALGHD